MAWTTLGQPVPTGAGAAAWEATHPADVLASGPALGLPQCPHDPGVRGPRPRGRGDAVCHVQLQKWHSAPPSVPRPGHAGPSGLWAHRPGGWPPAGAWASCPAARRSACPNPWSSSAGSPAALRRPHPPCGEPDERVKCRWSLLHFALACLVALQIGCYLGFALAWRCLLHSRTAEKDR